MTEPAFLTSVTDSEIKKGKLFCFSLGVYPPTGFIFLCDLPRHRHTPISSRRREVRSNCKMILQTVILSSYPKYFPTFIPSTHPETLTLSLQRHKPFLTQTLQCFHPMYYKFLVSSFDSHLIHPRVCIH